jgi:NO-binding membrane sensor protein with MHYT domain
MFFTYDPILVIFSIIVSIMGAYTCFDLVIKIRKNGQDVEKKLLITAAFAIGGSIWAMHFVAMLAVDLPVLIRYDVLTTIVSGLVSVLMTAVALLIISTAPYTIKRVLVAGVIMGFGISSMHYVGMSAIRGNCGLSYSMLWILVSIFIGMAASTASLWAAMTLHGLKRKLVAALVMGISISGVHYTGMLGTTFIPIDKALEFSQPIMSAFSLGLVTAIATFIILGYTLLTLVPEANSMNAKSSLNQENNDKPAMMNEEETGHVVGKIPIQKNQKTYFVDMSDVVSISAYGHYTKINSISGEECFCNYSLSNVEKELDPQVFLRVHRSHIVSLQHIKSFERRHDKGLIAMNSVDNPIPVSRTNIGKVLNALGI